MNGLTGNIKHSNGLITTHSKSSEYKNKKRRVVLPGYPVTKKFETIEEIENYFACEKIVCLLCGKSFKTLCTHLASIHGTTSEQYKIDYGLPLRHGLSRKETLQMQSNNFKKMLEDGTINVDEETKKKIREKANRSPRKKVFQPYRRKMYTERINKHLSDKYEIQKDGKLFISEDYEKILESSLEFKQHPFEICANNVGVLPSAGMVRAYSRENKEFRKRYLETVDKLPFAVQAAHGQLGKRFKKKLISLIESGYSNVEISNMLSVCVQTISNYKVKYNIKNPERTHCHRGHKYTYINKTTKRCYECGTINRRKRGVLSREDASNCYISGNCPLCGVIVLTKKLGKNKYCEECKNREYYESQKRYALKNKERRKEMAKIAYEKRKNKRN